MFLLERLFASNLFFISISSFSFSFYFLIKHFSRFGLRSFFVGFRLPQELLDIFTFLFMILFLPSQQFLARDKTAMYVHYPITTANQQTSKPAKMANQQTSNQASAPNHTLDQALDQASFQAIRVRVWRGPPERNPAGTQSDVGHRRRRHRRRRVLLQ